MWSRTCRCGISRHRSRQPSEAEGRIPGSRPRRAACLLAGALMVRLIRAFLATPSTARPYGPAQHPAGPTQVQACGGSARGRPAGPGQEHMTMTAEPPGSPVTEAVRSLELRWIFPGQLESAVARWFGRFPAGTEAREDIYLLDPPLPGLSVKVRGGGALEVKAYRGSPGILEVAGRARGRMESWQKWSFPFSPLSPGSGEAPGWRPLRKRRRISRFPLASGQIRARRGAGPAAAVRGGTDRGPHKWPGLVDPGVRGDRPRRSAAQRTPGHRRARVRPRSARWGGTRHGRLQVLCGVAVPAAGRP